MSLSKFHHALLGKNPSRTPAQLHLTYRQEQFYEKFETNEVRGFASPGSFEEFVAIFVASLHLTDGEGLKVAILRPEKQSKYTRDNIQKVCRHLLRERKDKIEGVRAIHKAFKALTMGPPPITPPSRFVLFGFSTEKELPSWGAGKLI